MPQHSGKRCYRYHGPDVGGCLVGIIELSAAALAFGIVIVLLVLSVG